MVWIVLVAVLLLLGLSWLPEMGVGDWQFRPIDLLADVRADSLGDDIEQLDSAPVVEHRVLSDTCRAGVTCINDMSDSTERGMTPLYHALTHINELGRPVRIAVLGDSYIEGDIFTADLRELLQEHYGGHGVGLVPITSDSPGFRRSVIHQFSGWTAHNANSKSGYSSQWANLTGHYFTAGNGAWVELSGVSKYLSRLDTCSTSSLIFLGSGTASVTATINGGEQQHFTASPQNGAGVLTTRGRIGRVRCTVTQSAGSQMAMIGATMEDKSGVVVDNFSLRSTSGLQLTQVSEQMFRDLDQARHYDLVVIMYGLNVAGKRTSDYSSYCQQMAKAIETMKRSMPDTGFLIVSVSDREQKVGGEYRTMRGVLNLVNAQQQLAFDTRIAFWNLYTAMGGEGSIVRMVENHEANLDYTHINFRGGHRLAPLLRDAIVWGQETYSRQNATN